MTRPREGQTFDGGSRLVRYINFVKLPHTVFALPFALVGATLASFGRRVTIARLAWIVLAFTAARFAASTSRSTILLKPIAAKRAAVKARMIQPSAPNVTGRTDVASVAPTSANGSAKTVCGSLTKLM